MDASQTGLELIARLAALAEQQPMAPAATSLDCTTVHNSMTYGDIARSTLHLAGQLRRELPPGSVVICCSPNRSELIPAVLGVLTAGMSVFPVHPRLTEPEMREAVERSGAKGLIGHSGAMHALKPSGLCSIDLDAIARVPSRARLPSWREFDQRHSALLLQTSGTTGRPNIVRRLAPALDAVAFNVAASIGLRRDDRILAAIPLYHAYGFENGILGPIAAGSCVLTCDGFHPAIVTQALEQQQVTVFPGVPFMFHILADLGTVRPTALRQAYSAGGPLPAGVVDAFYRLTGVRIGQLYGASEIGSVTFNDAGKPGYDPSSVGLPMTGVEIRIIEGSDVVHTLPPNSVGQVAVRADSMLHDYMDSGAPALTSGFVLTGDLGRLDDDGRLTITGRSKLQIDIGGVKVNPLEVEQVLRDHPGVRDCAVVPLPVTDTVNRLKAVIELEPGHRGFDPGDLRRFARTRLAAHKVPRVIEVCDALPRLPTGKIRRQALVEA